MIDSTPTVDNGWRATLQSFVQSPENRCFVCGPGNDRGLRLCFQSNEAGIEAEFSPEEWQQGWTGVVHGGILAAILDEAMAYVLFYGGIQGVTGRMGIRFRRAARANDRLRVEARLVRETEKIADVEGHLWRGSALVAEADARFLKLGPVTTELLLAPAKNWPEDAGG